MQQSVFRFAEMTQGVSEEVCKKLLRLPVFFFWRFPAAAFMFANMFTCPVDNHRDICQKKKKKITLFDKADMWLSALCHFIVFSTVTPKRRDIFLTIN